MLWSAKADSSTSFCVSDERIYRRRFDRWCWTKRFNSRNRLASLGHSVARIDRRFSPVTNIAVAAGAVLHQGVRAARIVEDNSGVQATLSDGTTLRARFLLGADGSDSQVARRSGRCKSWRHDQYVLCANEDIPYSPQAIERFYGSRFSLFVFRSDSTDSTATGGFFRSMSTSAEASVAASGRTRIPK
jgi:2-polyprenyl-6-methoxyphenol hydroxylase-like FAD-dependent oxidoreductase